MEVRVRTDSKNIYHYIYFQPGTEPRSKKPVEAGRVNGVGVCTCKGLCNYVKAKL